VWRNFAGGSQGGGKGAVICCEKKSVKASVLRRNKGMPCDIGVLGKAENKHCLGGATRRRQYAPRQ